MGRIGTVRDASVVALGKEIVVVDPNTFVYFFVSCSGGVWTCPYSLESMSSVNWAIGMTGVYGKGYIPPGAMPMSQEDIAKIPIRNIEEVFDEMESSYAKPMPESVRERLDFM